MKFFLPLALFVAFAFSACNTLENRRSLYSNEKVYGPYTRQWEETWRHGSVVPPKTVDEQYDQTRRQARRPKLIQPKATPSATAVPSAGADAVPVP